MYELKGKVQNYDWGVVGNNSLVAQIHLSNGDTIDESKNYAEYWMGTHINGPSKLNINNEEVSLLSHLNSKHNLNGLPFLFKVLSIKDTLSIQVHPEKKFAEVLNKIDSLHYKDDNHKPELAISISEVFELFYGIIPINQALEISNIIHHTCSVNELKNLVEFIENPEIGSYKNLISEIISINNHDLIVTIDKILNNIDKMEDKNYNTVDKFCKFKLLHEKFGNDRGVIFSLFMNYYKLLKGEAIFISPNIPHAYIKGDCIECMANSDNVIRLGLTTKFVDIQNFFNILDHNFSAMIQNTLPKIGQETSKNSILYQNCDFKEFFVVKFNLEEGEQMSYQLNNFSILILLKGDLIIKSDDEISIKKYGIYFLENNFTFNFKGSENESVEFYIASY